MATTRKPAKDVPEVLDAPTPSVMPESFAVESPEKVPSVGAPSAPAEPSVTLVSELDAYIRDRQKSQPQTLEEVEIRAAELRQVNETRHRLVLPDFFENLSADCTWREGCPFHKEERARRWIFRWIYKVKHALDTATDNAGWAIANRTLFPSAPRELFRPSGAVEKGDAVLAFLPVARALELRAAPVRKSQELLRNRMQEVPVKPGEPPYVLMTGDASDERFYKPDLGPEGEPAPGEGVSIDLT